ncbi:MAG: C40 family peptidase [Clostridia bacterium]|nr:C40 family peptidase [Clostridia bacterium]MDE7215488.1 C40 family peptidase [Clostridia bacterium]
MKKLISTVTAVIMICALSAFGFAACLGNDNSDDRELSSQWSVNWDAYRPNLSDPMPSEPPDDGTEEPDDENSGASVVTPPQVIAPVIKYSSMIKSDTQGLNIRSAPSTSSSIVGSMDKGDMLRYEGSVNGWYKTVYKQRVAYVYAGNNYAHIVQMKQSSADKVEKIISVGEELMGYPYVWGSQRYHWGNGKLNTAFVQGEYDCSALMQYIFYHGAGILLDLNTRTQVLQGKTVANGDLKRGDVMFFTNASRYNNTGVERVGHVALYLGDNYILHTASDHAVIEEISATRWSYFITAKRFV